MIPIYFILKWQVCHRQSLNSAGKCTTSWRLCEGECEWRIVTKREYRASCQGGRQKEIDSSAESEKWFNFCQNVKALLSCRATYPILVRFLKQVAWCLQNIKMWFIHSVWFGSAWSAQKGPVSPLVHKFCSLSLVSKVWLWFPPLFYA
jgi:hypothetical protein